MVLTVTLAACDDQALPSGTPYDVGGRYAGIAALAGDAIVVAELGDPASGTAGRLVRINLAEASASPLSVDVSVPCETPDYLRPTTLPDGRLGALATCPPGSSALALAIDVDSGVAEIIREIATVPGQVAWDPSMERAVVDLGSDICGSLAIVDGNTISPMTLTVSANGKSFALEAALRSIPGGDCRPDGRAAWPTWSSSDRLAFFASTASMGVAGDARIDTPWSLFVTDPDAATADSIADGITSPRSLAWSEDGSRLAFAGTVADASGTWIASERGALTRVSDVAFEWLAWQPSHSDLIGLVRSGGPSSPTLDLVGVRLVPTGQD